jgi:hypothetical protein
MGAAAIAVINMKERHIVDAFRQAGVTTAESARLPEELNVATHGVAWRALLNLAIIREAGGGRYYLDLPSWEANRRSRLRRIAILTVLLIALAFWLVATRP